MDRGRLYNIVIADDDLDDQFLIKDALHHLKVRVNTTSVYTGLQLMDLLLKREAYKNIQEEIDVVLLDLNMPLMDGFEALRRIREKPCLADLKVFVLTTSNALGDKEKAEKLGANGFITKPPTFEGLQNVLSGILNIETVAEKNRQIKVMNLLPVFLEDRKPFEMPFGMPGCSELVLKDIICRDENDWKYISKIYVRVNDCLFTYEKSENQKLVVAEGIDSRQIVPLEQRKDSVTFELDIVCGNPSKCDCRQHKFQLNLAANCS